MKLHHSVTDYRSLSQADSLTHAPWRNFRQSVFVFLSPKHLKKSHEKIKAAIAQHHQADPFFFTANNAPNLPENQLKVLMTFNPTAIEDESGTVPISLPSRRTLHRHGPFMSLSQYATKKMPYGIYADAFCHPSDHEIKFAEAGGEYCKEVARVIIGNN